jgi:ATP-dependent Clp protease ATP-binding subunit ClpC
VFERFAPEARLVITQAQQIARDLRHDYIGTEHLLLGMEGTSAGEVLQGLGADFGQLREGVLGIVGQGSVPPTGAPAFTARAKKVLELALREALARDDRAIRPEHVLLGIVREGDGLACVVLAEHGVTRERIGDAVGWARPARRRRFRPPFTRLEAPAMGDAVMLRAHTLSGGGAAESQHYLLALLADETSRAARVLAALGVTREAVEAKLDEMGTVDVEVAGERFEVSPEQAEQLKRWLSGEGPPPAA